MSDAAAADPVPVAPLFVDETRNALNEALGKIEHCLGQLQDADVNWRPFASQNSIANVILHLCGNLRQWVVSGVGGAPDVRDRPAEFADRREYATGELLDRLRQAVREADAALASADVTDLARVRRIQGWDVSGVHAAVNSVSHFVGHSHEIVYITRLRLGEKYRFQFVPATVDQGAPE
jgi:hypothetical protein